MKPDGYGTTRGDLEAERLDATFAALADPTRRAILAQLASGPAAVTELAQPFAMSQPAVSKHLKVLERAGLVSRGREAQRRPCRLEPRPLQVATDWLEDYRSLWEERYQGLDTLLDELQTASREDHGRARPASGGGTRRQAGRRRPGRRSSGQS
jgi:DNA-binding transcriptional ArsR family regulator